METSFRRAKSEWARCRFIRIFGVFLFISVCLFVQIVHAWDTALPHEYGRVVLANRPQRNGLAPAVFDHWRHRSRFTCRLCHMDLGFAMKARGTGVTAAMNIQGLYCGACHNGKRLADGKPMLSSCSKSVPRDAGECERCHVPARDAANERDFKDFAAKMPKKSFGNGIDWEAAESKGLIKPIDFLEGISVRRPPMKTQEDFSIEANVTWASDVVFSHKKHAVWIGCEVCHPEIFPIVKGAEKYTMLDISGGEYCGVCHDKVAFPLAECQRCHSGAMK